MRFLYDYPWTSKPVLESMFGPGFSKLIKKKQTRQVSVPGIGLCWGVSGEKLSSLPGVRRREQAKLHLIQNIGKDALWEGGSPGPWGSDLIARVGGKRNKWIRVWVDNEEPGVEALPFLHPVPARFAANLLDLIITQSAQRAEMIKRQLKSHWKKGSKNALIYMELERDYLPLGNDQLLAGTGLVNSPIKEEEVRRWLTENRWKRLENVRHDQNIGKLFLSLAEVDFTLLKFVGDNPLFNTNDLAMLISSSSTDSIPVGTLGKKQAKAVKRLTSLNNLGLLEDAAPPITDKKLSVLGLEVLAKYWGVELESMRRFQAWPQKHSEEFGLQYSENALSYIKVHTRMVQQFVFGLIDNAWRLRQEYGGVDVSLDTIVGKRIYFQDLATGTFDWVIPDATIDLSFWRKTWRDGHVHDPKIVYADARLLLEMDRGTYSIPRLKQRAQKYGKIWRSLSGNPVQVWVIDGSPWREKEILEMLEEAGINGWTVLIERLQLESGDPWWSQHSFKEGVLGYNKHVGYAPLRKIWRRAGDYQLHNLLDHTPWKRKMSQSKPMVRVPRGY